MTDCDRCDATDLSSWNTLYHVSYEGEMFSQMKSRMEVCSDCYDEMKESDRWDW